MFTKLVPFFALAAVAQAGLLAASGHYSSAAVSSQSITRHEKVHPVAKIPIAAPIAYHAQPAHYSAPLPAHYSAPVQPHYSAPSQELYHASPEVVSNHEAPLLEHSEHSHPKYEFSYSVSDSHTGDNKSHQEIRNGDAVKGSYSFQEADGSIRTVEYTADDHNGFNAVVHNSAPSEAPVHLKSEPVVVAPAYYHH